MTYAEALLVTEGYAGAADEDLLRWAYAVRNFSPTEENLARVCLSREVWQARNAALLEAVKGAEARRAEGIRAADARKRAAQARRAARQGVPARATCERCGAEHSANQMMRGSRQLLCPGCYDRVEGAL